MRGKKDIWKRGEGKRDIRKEKKIRYYTQIKTEREKKERIRIRKMFKAIERRYRDRKVQDIMKRRTNIVLRDRTLEREGMDKFLQADIG